MALSKKDKQGLLIMGGVVAVVLVILVAKSAAGNKPKPDSFGCLPNITANTVIVIDHSEQISKQTKNEITARALAFVETNVVDNERVSVFTISEVSKKSLTPIFSACKPARDGNRLIEPVQILAKKFKTQFQIPLTTALSTDPGDSKESPLAQALIDISLTQYLRGAKNNLLVFSDMLEHVPGKFSMYPPQACRDQQATIKLFRDSKKGAQERPAFINTSVYLNIIPRTDVARSAIMCRDQLWPWFFGNNQGESAKLSPDFLPGT